MPRPCLTASTMVAKLSSVSVMSAAPLATSVPVMPMAQPMSAALSAGASFTPSPVIATTWSLRCQAFTMRILSSGDTRAYTDISSTSSSSCASLMACSSAPVMARLSWSGSGRSGMIPIARAMALAVTTWSPVIIIGRIPA